MGSIAHAYALLGRCACFDCEPAKFRLEPVRFGSVQFLGVFWVGAQSLALIGYCCRTGRLLAYFVSFSCFFTYVPLLPTT